MSMRTSALLGVLQKDDGTSLYQHLCETLSRLHETDDPLAAFELLSKYVRDGRFPGVRPADVDVREEDPLAQSREQHGRKTKALEDLSAGRIGDVADFWEQSRMLRLAGLGFSDAENYTLSMSIRKLAASRTDCTMARFWGKVLGKEQDYYVVELQLAGSDATFNRKQGEQKVYDELADGYVEPRGVGTNAFVYMVCNELTGAWVQLPAAEPAKICRSREINRLLTGRLDAPVWSHPAFPWPEVDLLRSMIARITCSTMLSPAGYYAAADGEGAQPGDLKVEGAVPGPDEIATPESWVHARPRLYLNGRVSYPAQGSLEELSGGTGPFAEKAKRVVAEKEKETNADVEPLAGIASEAETLTTAAEARKLPEQCPAPEKQWSLRKMGDLGTYNMDPSGETVGVAGARNYAVTVVSSLRYPGAAVVCQGTKFCNFYVGNLVKKQRAFLPRGVSEPSAIESAEATRWTRSKECNCELAPGVIQDEADETKELITQEDQEGEDQLGEAGEEGEEDEDEAGLPGN